MEKRIEQRINSLLNDIPGYGGYRTKEDRRDDDRRLREAIAGQLARVVSTLTGVGASLASQRSFTHISTIERLVGATRLLADRVRTASYGYGGIFTDREVDEFALDQLRQFDATFERETARLGELADRLAESPEGPLESDLTAYQAELQRVSALFDARAGVVDSARPSREADVLKMLEPPPPPKISPLASLRVGDALSILGDNYLVDATVTFSERDRQVALSRAGEDSEGNAVWLVGGTTGDVASAKLSQADAGAVTGGSGRPAEAVVATPAGTQESAPAEYAYTAGADNSVSFWYAIGGERRSFTGVAVVDDDIEVYGQA